MPKRVFISYRREDTAPAAGRVYDRLCQLLSKENIFFDIDGIKGGEDFERKLAAELSRCDAVLIFIGKRWAEPSLSGKPRLCDEDDFVRAEVRAALGREILKVPIFVDGASMPKGALLPNDIRAVTKLNGLPLRHESFDNDTESIVATITGTLGIARSWDKRSGLRVLLVRILLGAIVAYGVLGLLALAHFIWLDRPLAASIGGGATEFVLIAAPIIGAGASALLSWKRLMR